MDNFLETEIEIYFTFSFFLNFDSRSKLFDLSQTLISGIDISEGIYRADSHHSARRGHSLEHRHRLRGLREGLREVRGDRDGAGQGQGLGVPQACQGECICNSL